MAITHPVRRDFLLGAVAASVSIVGSARAQSRTDTDPRTLDGKPMPEPASDRSAGPVAPGRGSALNGKVAVVTGAARGIGRAIAVELQPTEQMLSPSTFADQFQPPPTLSRRLPRSSTKPFARSNLTVGARCR
jgi:hypothetical protein